MGDGGQAIALGHYRGGCSTWFDKCSIVTLWFNKGDTLFFDSGEYWLVNHPDSSGDGVSVGVMGWVLPSDMMWEG